MRPPRPHTVFIAAAATLVLGLSACANSGEGGSPETAQPGGGGHDQVVPAPIAGAAELAVTATSFRFEPAELTLTAGEPVNVALTSTDTLHDFTIDGQSFHLTAEPGQTATGGLTLDQPGTYTAYCTVPGHREAGMEATVTVQ